MGRKKAKSKGVGPWKRMVKCLDLPEYAIGLDESVEILGGNTVQVEGARGIHTYEKELIKLHMKDYLLVLRGEEFDLAHFSDGCLRIFGRLQSVSWEEDEQ